MAVSPYSNQHSDQTIAQINITPLVDVMLVLLVIFMLATPILSAPLPMQLPQAGESSDRPARVTLRIEPSGQFALGGEALSAAQLDAALHALAREAPRTVLEIDASADSDYQGFATALGAARASGLTNITLPR